MNENGEIITQKKLPSNGEIIDFLKSFGQEIQVGKDAITINYTIPMPPLNSDREVVGVLPFTQHGRPYRSRTCDTLIKSQKPDVPPHPSR